MLRHFLSNARSLFSRNNKYTFSPSVNALRNNENGNIFFMLFGAVAVVGTLGAVTVSTMRGPLSTMVEVQARTKAESEMAIASRLAMLEATELANNGDCDGDGFVEPLEYRTGGGPTGGGLLPSSISSSRIDPWGTEYGYCVWDGGTTINDTINCDNNGTAGLQILDGDGSAGESYTIIAIISAGEDQVFQTTCTEGPPSLNKGGDDIVSEFTYAAAAVATDGLWNLKSGDPDTAQIAKNLEIDGSASFSGGIDLRSSTSALTLGAASMLFPTDTTPGMGNGDCNAANHGLLRVNTATDPDTLEICDSATGWSNVGSGGSVWSQNTGNEIFFDSVGTTEVGIGTNAPTKTLDIVGTLGVSGAVNLGSTLDVSGISTLDDVEVTTLDASDAVDFNSTLNVDGTSTLADVNANATTVTTLGATGAVDFDTTLNVDGTSTLADVNANATTVTTLGATGAVDFDSTLNVDGSTTLGGTLDAQGTISNSGGNVNIGDDLDVNGNYSSTNGDITLTNGTVEADNYTWNGNDFTPSTCASGSFNRWDGNSWVCESDTAGGGGGGAIQENLSDDDGDTLIQLEETVDDDTIRFDTAGSQRVTIGPTGDIDMRGNGTSLNIDLNHGSGYPTLTSTATHIRLVENIIVDQRSFQITDSGNDRRTTMSHLNNTDFRMTTSQGSIFLQPAENVGIGDFTSDTIDSTLHIQTGDIRLDGGADNQAGCIRFVEGTGLQFSDDCSTFTAFSDVTGTPGGSSTQIQYNDGGSFAGDSGLTYDDINNTLTVDGAVVINGQTGDAPAFANIEDLDNVSISSITNDQCLKYNNATSNWENGSCAAGSSLWTDNTTHITRGNVHLLNSGETMTSSGLDIALGKSMFYHQDKGALRVGTYGHSAYTSESVIGQDSFAYGHQNRASGENAFAGGYQSIANGGSSLAMGDQVNAQGAASIALGRATNATGAYSFAFGLGGTPVNDTTVSGSRSLGIFMGNQGAYDLTADNRMALVGGDFLIDDDGTAGSQGCIRYVEGTGLQFSHDCSTFTTMTGAGGGIWTDNTTHITRENFHILDAGATMTTAGFDNTIGSAFVWYPDKRALRAGSSGGGTKWNESEIGDNSFVMGNNSRATNNHSFAFGSYTNVTGEYSIGMGNQADVFANGSSSIGRQLTVNGTWSHARGNRADVSGDNSWAFGLGNAAGTYPIVSGDSSFGIFMGDQSGYDLSTANRMALIGGDFLIDDDGTAGSQGCIRYVEGTGLQFSHDCSTFTTMGGVASGAIAINDLSDGTTDYTTDFNIFMGQGAGSTIASGGQYNLAIGQNALAATTSGDNNTAIGYGAGDDITIGFSNTIMGERAGNSLTEGDSNTLIGRRAGWGLTTERSNTFIGAAAGLRVQGAQNVIIGTGAQSGVGNFTSSYSVVIGDQAAQDAPFTDSVIIGSSAGTSGSGDNVIAIGRSTASSQSGNYNIYMGENTGDNETGSNNIILGHGLNTPGGTASNHLNIGGLIYGDLANEDFIVGSYQLDDTGTGTEDSRLFFDKSRGAFRAGTTNGTQWDSVNVGSNSIVLGLNSTASGYASMAIGNGLLSDGIATTALGANATASGTNSMAIGLGSATNPIVSGTSSLGIFMGDQSGYDLSTANRMALVGGDFLIDDDGTAGSQGCIRYVEGTGLQFSHDCSTYTNMGAASLSWPLTASDGTEAAPSYAFANSTGSGLYYDGTNMHMTTTEGSIYFDVDTDNNNGTDRWVWRTPNHTYVNKMTLSGTTLNIGASQDSDINGLDINGWSGDQGIIITNTFSGDGDTIIKMELTEDTPLITMGLDDSDADRFKVSGGALDTNDRITIETTGEIGLGDFTGDTIDSALHILTGDIRLDGGAANEAGCIRYNDTADQLEYSDDCSTFAAFSSGSSLWTDNTTHVTRENFHIIDAGQTSDTTSLSDAGGAGTRAFYDTDSGALRGGSISASNNAWDDGNIGNNSLAWGNNAEASGSAAFAFGNNATASGYTTMAVGNNASASSSGGIAFGDYASSSNQDAFAFGAYSRARKLYSLALGYGADADGTASVAIGRKVKVTGNYSQALSAGEASGTAPVVSGGNSVGVFLGDQSGVDISNSNVMAILGGDVGIGTTSPTGIFTIAGDGEDIHHYSYSASSGNKPDWYGYRARGTESSPAAVQDNDLIAGWGANAFDGSSWHRTAVISAEINGTVSAGNVPTDIIFETASSNNASRNERMRITSTGNLGVGTQNPNLYGTDRALTVSGNNGVSGTAAVEIEGLQTGSNGNYAALLMYNGSSNGVGLTGRRYGADNSAAMLFSTSNAGTFTEKMRLSPEGYLGIGEDTPNVALDVAGDIEHTGTITDVSDIRLKDNIKPLNKTGNLLERINQIETYSFTMKGDEKSRIEYGVMAQELEEIFPTLVHTADDEMGTKSVNYVGLVAPMIEATKELKAENDSLKSQMDDLSQQVALLNKMAGNNVDKASMRDFILLLFGLFFGMALMVGLQRRNNG